MIHNIILLLLLQQTPILSIKQKTIETMGGDDLGSDDEFLAGGVVEDHDDDDLLNYPTAKKESVLKTSTVAVIEEDEDEGDGNKRKRKSNAEEEEEVSPSASSSASKKKKSKKSRSKVLLEAARSIEEESAEQQAAFTWTALLHHHQLKSGKEGDTSNSSSDMNLQPKLQPHHFKTCSPNSTTMEARLRDVIPSMKQLKTWKQTKSPMVLILCISARRAVQVLKDINPFKTRAAKLFAKHMQVSEQEEMLRSQSFGIAVGTPHRLQVLCEKNALQLTHTKLVVLDVHKDAKNFTVCTLPDTAHHCMEFLRDQVLPQLQERPKECKLAFC